jgi:hypothetical protein
MCFSLRLNTNRPLCAADARLGSRRIQQGLLRVHGRRAAGQARGAAGGAGEALPRPGCVSFAGNTNASAYKPIAELIDPRSLND